MTGWLRSLADAWRRVDQLWFDWIPVAGLLLLSQFDPNLSAAGQNVAGLADGAFALATVVPLGWRRHWPLAVVVGVASVIVGWALAVGPVISFSSFLALIVAMYAVAAHGRTTHALIGAALTAFAVVIVALTDQQPSAPLEWVFPLFYFGGAWLLGRGTRRRLQHQRTLLDLNMRLEREHETEARLAVADERARIARELHDIIAHGVGVMVVHAEAADEVLGTDPDGARESLRQIQTSGRQALTELRQLLGLLRDDPPRASLTPQPSVADLDELAREVSLTGLSAEIHIEGERYPLPAGLDLTTYRIVQEALTNAGKHGHADTARVCIRYRADELSVDIDDNGHCTDTPQLGNGGHGLIGMRERVALYGGSLETGRGEHGYSVHAVLPTTGAP
ncbi:MAG: sensor histidine kinase [Actinomycetota bacterium]|nr:sensor histidine kinase [Actinomycetota bacterium]